MQAVTIQQLQNAVLLIDKPAGVTSSETVGIVKKILKARKIGHSGTLDKFASGLLVVCTGMYTKLTRFFLDSDKRYTGSVRLGVATDTDDVEGAVMERRPVGDIADSKLDELVSAFSGRISQRPPQYSALKLQGRRASDLMRSGKDVSLAEREVEIRDFRISRSPGDPSLLSIEVACTKGTYIRSLARDMGAMLGTGAHLESLRRTGSGAFSVAEAAGIDELRAFAEGYAPGKRFYLTPREALADFGCLVVSEEGRRKVLNGAFFAADDVLEREKRGEKPCLILDEKKNCIAIVEVEFENWRINYLNVFNGV